MTQIDLQLVAAWGVALLMIGFVVLLYFMRDTTSSPPHRVTRMVQCPTHHSRAQVDFNERVSTGMVVRRIARCSLRERGMRCDGRCADNIEIAEAHGI